MITVIIILNKEHYSYSSLKDDGCPFFENIGLVGPPFQNFRPITADPRPSMPQRQPYLGTTDYNVVDSLFKIT